MSKCRGRWRAGQEAGAAANRDRDPASFAWPFNRRFQLDTLTKRLAYACARTAPHPYRVIIAE